MISAQYHNIRTMAKTGQSWNNGKPLLMLLWGLRITDRYSYETGIVPLNSLLILYRDDGIFIKHRQGKSSDAETPFTRPRPIAETTFTPPRPIAQHPFFLQEIDRGDSFSNLRDRPRRLLFQHGSVISRNWSASPIFVKLRESSRTRLTEYIRG